MSLRDDLDRLADKISLPKRFPGYFSKWVFRVAILIMVILMGVVAYTDKLGVEQRIYLSCPNNSNVNGRCVNPFYGLGCIAQIPAEYGDLCSKEFFLPGETYGEPPSWLQSNFVMIGFGVVALAFLVNHLLFWRRSGKWSY